MVIEESSWLDLDALTDRRISREEIRAFFAPIVAKTGETFEVKGASSNTVSVRKFMTSPIECVKFWGGKALK
ncbi:MAG TPA: hypothetical protein VGZ00_05000 [Candidatus Baltobacteraceae bacterium]|jgi:hypothetical protein|nr:hypothetical protein [Candidatus Baltobacteraceae bacterium]